MWDADALTGPIFRNEQTFISIVILPKRQYLRVWWRDRKPVCSVLALGWADEASSISEYWFE
jgi:hypothetical protein